MLSCQSNSSTKSANINPKRFIGEWESISLEIRVNSYDGIADSTLIITADSSNWTEILNMLPIRTVFQPDHSYYATYRNPDSTIQSKTSGYFELKGADSMIIHKELPYPETIRHTWFRKDDSTYGFIGVLDFDQDGIADDEMFALNRRIAY
ncbi:MAG: hypothetical protein ACI959_000205 [Limisphaerales bacterium]|jgi:hypothetical protein